MVHKAGFAGGKVQRKKQTGNSEEVSMCKVKLDHGGEIISVEEDSIEKVCSVFCWNVEEIWVYLTAAC